MTTSQASPPPPKTGSLAERLAQVPRMRVAGPVGDEVDPRVEAQAWAATWKKAGLGPGHRLGVHLPNGPSFAAALLACLDLGVTFIPLPPRLTPEERRERTTKSGVTAELEGDTLRVVSGAHPVEGVAKAVVLFTSGTESGGRAVALSGTSLLHVVDTHHAALGYPAGTQVPGYLPWSHAFGLTLELLMGLLHGARVRTVPPEALPEALAQTRDPFLFTVPAVLEKLSGAALEKLGGGIVGGAPVRGRLLGRLRASRLRVGYGQTECAPGVTLGAPGEWPREGFLGRPLGCELSLQGEPGEAELWVRGPNVGLGWLEGATVRPLCDAQGWRHTGDLAESRADGYYFLGRQDDLFKLGNGRMLNPLPLEMPYDGRLLLIPTSEGVQPLLRGEAPLELHLPVPHLPPVRMSEDFWKACTTATGKISRRRAQQLFLES